MTERLDSESDGRKQAARHERRRVIVQRCLQALMRTDPQLFYQPTSTIAREIHAAARRPDALDDEEREALEPLTVRDIEMLLAFR